MEWSVVESIARSYLTMASSADYGVSRDGKRRFNAMLGDPIYAEWTEQLKTLAHIAVSTVVKPSFTMGSLSPDGGCFYKQGRSGVIKSAPIGKDRAVSLAIGILRDAGWVVTVDGASMVGEQSGKGREGWVDETPAEKWYRENPKK